jgi:DNA-binding FrmR family transcriptional regulator
MLDTDLKKKVLTRMKRVQGQIQALERMISQDDSCVDVLLQISAAQGALGKVGEIILAAHIQTCVSDAFEHGSKPSRQQTIEELMDVFARYSRIGTR